MLIHAASFHHDEDPSEDASGGGKPPIRVPLYHHDPTLPVSYLHYLVPASEAKPPVCAVAAAAMVNRYSMPTIIGYKGEGEFDAHAAHIAKLRSIALYLHNQDETHDDDLVLVVDGFDALAQIPAEAMIERYFDIMAAKDQKLADKYGMTVDEVHDNGIRQTILWGTDKGCFPNLPNESQCWLIPDSHLERLRFGLKTNNGELQFSDSKFLNSGTVMAPVGDLRNLIDATLEFIDRTWDTDFKYKNSDQYYLSNMYARQEYRRMVDMQGEYPNADGRQLPRLRQEFAEYHIAVDFDTAFTQTQCHNDRFMRKLRYGNPDHTTTVTEDSFGDGNSFRPFKIQMPSNLYISFTNLWKSLLEEERPEDTTDKQWIQSLRLGTNIATRVIYGFYHNTCSKHHFLARFKDHWYYDLLQPLLKAATRDNLARRPISEKLMDGRLWMPANLMGLNGSITDEFGGVFTDYETETFIPFQQFCNTTELFDIQDHEGDDEEP